MTDIKPLSHTEKEELIRDCPYDVIDQVRLCLGNFRMDQWESIHINFYGRSSLGELFAKRTLTDQFDRECDTEVRKQFRELYNRYVKGSKAMQDQMGFTYKNQYTLAQKEVDGKVEWIICQDVTEICNCGQSLSNAVRTYKALELEAFARFMG